MELSERLLVRACRCVACCMECAACCMECVAGCMECVACCMFMITDCALGRNDDDQHEQSNHVETIIAMGMHMQLSGTCLRNSNR